MLQKNQGVIKVNYCLILLVCFFAITVQAEEAKKNPIDPTLVKVYNPVDGEEDFVHLRTGQTANIKIYLGSLGDMVDKYMVTLLNMETNELVASILSDEQGEVMFRKILPGNYSVYVNKRVKEDGEFSSVKVTDVKITTYP